MWVLTSFFVLTTLVLVWLCAAYFAILRFVSFLKKRPVAPIPGELPSLSIVVPCHNEADLIVDKLDNLLACDYPREKMEIVFVDGGSTDDTVKRLSSAIPPGSGIRISHAPRKGKISQLNHVLATLCGQYVVVTDADGRMRPDTLKQLAAEFAFDPRIGVVGAYSSVANAIWRDRCFWDAQNRGRLMESDAYSSSIVIATCYAFRQGLLTEFPEDVVADDVYIGFLANALGHRVVYSRQAVVEELRGPCHLSEFFSHKFRKNNAFLHESLRFLYRLPDMGGFCKLMVLTRIGQQLLLPWATGLWSLLALTLLTLGRLDLLIVASAFIALTMLITSQAFESMDVPRGLSARYGLYKQGRVFFETQFVLFAAGLSYPFFRQNSSYSRLRGSTVATARPRARPADTVGSLHISRGELRGLETPVVR
jgi:cellulose synthase/poly-beta-1,6-N-acetylglucosamine synthase-like glycosyltransferase